MRTHDLCVSAAVLYQLIYEDQYIGSRPICWVHLHPWMEWNMEWRLRDLRKYKFQWRYVWHFVRQRVCFHNQSSVVLTKKGCCQFRKVTSSLTLYYTSLQSARFNHQQSVLTDLPYMKKFLYNVWSTDISLPFPNFLSTCKQKQKDSLCIMIIHSLKVFILFSLVLIPWLILYNQLASLAVLA